MKIREIQKIEHTYIHTCIHMYEQEEEDDGQEIKDKKENCRERQGIFIQLCITMFCT